MFNILTSLNPVLPNMYSCGENWISCEQLVMELWIKSWLNL